MFTYIFIQQLKNTSIEANQIVYLGVANTYNKHMFWFYLYNKIMVFTLVEMTFILLYLFDHIDKIIIIVQKKKKTKLGQCFNHVQRSTFPLSIDEMRFRSLSEESLKYDHQYLFSFICYFNERNR